MSNQKQFKVKVAPEALKDEPSLVGLASSLDVYPTMTRTWKKALLQRTPSVFERGGWKP